MKDFHKRKHLFWDYKVLVEVLVLAGGSGSGYEFPTAYQNLINNYSANAVRYYDPVDGNDSNTGFTQATAKQNVGTDMNSWLAAGANGRIAVLLPGSHHVSPQTSGSYASRKHV